MIRCAPERERTVVIEYAVSASSGPSKIHLDNDGQVYYPFLGRGEVCEYSWRG
jgi:hypothetical protein